MAGDWLKMEASTPDKPEVLAMTARMGWDDPDLTVGKLFRVWRWFDQQTTNGNAVGVTAALLDRIAGVAGFANAMAEAGWLVISEGGVSLPNFDKHNGATAKSRAQTAKRVANHRASDPSNADSNATTVTTALAREEKRREEEIPREEKKLPAPSPRGAEAAPPPAFDGRNFEILNGKSVVPIAATFDLPEAWGIDAEALGWKPGEVLRESEKFRQYWTAGKGQGSRRSVKGWRQSWSNWLEKAARDKR